MNNPINSLSRGQSIVSTGARRVRTLAQLSAEFMAAIHEGNRLCRSIDRSGQGADSIIQRAMHQHHTACRVAKILRLSVDRFGTPPEAELWVANHLGYLDIVALLSVGPVVFVAKSEVADWPLFGALASLGGTIYIDRNRRHAVAEAMEAMIETVASGVPVVVFPEGTSSDGQQVLPFHAALLQPAIDQGWRVAPVGIRYEVEPGTVASEVCYWGRMTLLPHLVNLAGKQSITASVGFGEVVSGATSRRQLARELRTSVEGLCGLSRLEESRAPEHEMHEPETRVPA